MRYANVVQRKRQDGSRPPMTFNLSLSAFADEANLETDTAPMREFLALTSAAAYGHGLPLLTEAHFVLVEKVPFFGYISLARPVTHDGFAINFNSDFIAARGGDFNGADIHVHREFAAKFSTHLELLQMENPVGVRAFNLLTNPTPYIWDRRPLRQVVMESVPAVPGEFPLRGFLFLGGRLRRSGGWQRIGFNRDARLMFQPFRATLG